MQTLLIHHWTQTVDNSNKAFILYGLLKQNYLENDMLTLVCTQLNSCDLSNSVQDAGLFIAFLKTHLLISNKNVCTNFVLSFKSIWKYEYWQRIPVLAISNPHLQSPGQFTDSKSTDLVQNVTSLITRELNSSPKQFLKRTFRTTHSARATAGI